jgi:FtsH-binding integral membrane protein
MYGPVLFLHSWMRWVALALILVSIVFAAQKRNDALAKKLSIFTMVSFHVQLLLGLLLYFVLSPVTKGAFADMGAAMKDGAVRFYVAEHLMGMIIAVALVSVGHIRAKKASDDGTAAKRRLMLFAIGLLVMLASIPWPFMAAGRPLFKF